MPLAISFLEYQEIRTGTLSLIRLSASLRILHTVTTVARLSAVEETMSRNKLWTTYGCCLLGRSNDCVNPGVGSRHQRSLRIWRQLFRHRRVRSTRQPRWNHLRSGIWLRISASPLQHRRTRIRGRMASISRKAARAFGPIPPPTRQPRSLTQQVGEFQNYVDNGDVTFNPASTLFFLAGGLNDHKTDPQPNRRSDDCASHDALLSWSSHLRNRVAPAGRPGVHRQRSQSQSGLRGAGSRVAS